LDKRQRSICAVREGGSGRARMLGGEVSLARLPEDNKLTSPPKVCFLFFALFLGGPNGGPAGAKRGRSGAPPPPPGPQPGPPASRGATPGQQQQPSPLLSTEYCLHSRAFVPYPRVGPSAKPQTERGRRRDTLSAILAEYSMSIQPIWYRCIATGVVQATRPRRSSAAVWQIYAQPL
jgi:hypothetical protein